MPGTSFVVTVDAGDNDHAVRVVDTRQIPSGSNPVTGFVESRRRRTSTTAWRCCASGRVYVSTGFGAVQALDVDFKTGALTRNDAASLSCRPSVAIGDDVWYYAEGLGVSPDGKHLVVGRVFDTLLLVYDIDPTSPTYQQQIGQLESAQKETLRRLLRPPRSDRHARLRLDVGRLPGRRD